MSSLTALVKQTVHFHSAKDGALWYETEDGLFRFPVPFAEVEGAIFLPEDKGLFFMRWIRREVERQNTTAA